MMAHICHCSIIQTVSTFLNTLCEKKADTLTEKMSSFEYIKSLKSFGYQDYYK